MIACIIAAMEDPGDRAFMEKLYMGNYAMMYRKALSITKNHHEAEDAVEATMIRMIDRIPLLRSCGRISLRAYLMRSVRNTAIDRLRRQKRLTIFPDWNEMIGDIPDDCAVDEGLIRQDQILCVVQALKKMPEHERELLKMKYYDEMQDAEIAQLIGVSRDSLRNRLNRARKRLGSILQEVEKNA